MKTESGGGDNIRKGCRTGLHLASDVTYYSISVDSDKSYESQRSWLEGKVVEIVFTGFQSHSLKLFFHGFQFPHSFGLCFDLIPQW